jgi:hypothetical protein
MGDLDDASGMMDEDEKKNESQEAKTNGNRDTELGNEAKKSTGMIKLLMSLYCSFSGHARTSKTDQSSRCSFYLMTVVFLLYQQSL